MQGAAQVIQAVAATLTALMSTVGFIVIILQLRQVERSVRGDAHGKLCDESFVILKLIADSPQTYPYFYDNVGLPEGSPDRVKVLCICECLANFLEHLVLQSENLPQPVWKTWRAFICDSYSRSPVLRDHFAKFRGWYTPGILAIITDCERSVGSFALNQRGTGGQAEAKQPEAENVA